MEKSTGNPGQHNGTAGKTGSIEGSGKTNSDSPSAAQTEGTTQRGTSTRQQRSEPSTRNETTQGTPLALVVEPPLPGTEPSQKPKKNRPKGLTYNKGGSTTPAKKGKTGGEVAGLTAAAIQGLFAVGATRLGPHWALSDEEAESIATPTANIIAKYLDTETLGKYSDPAALLIALGVVVVPRVMITMQTKKKEVKPHGPVNTNRENEPDRRENARPNLVKSQRGPIDPSQADVEELLRIVNASPY